MKFCDPPAKEPTRKNGGMRTNEMMTSRRVVVFFFRAIGPRVPIDSPTNKNRKMIYVVPPIAKQRSATEIIYIHTHLL